MSNIYEKDTYLNPYIEYLFNHPIYEYDISDAGLNLTQRYGLLSSDVIEKIRAMPKNKHAYELGLIQRKNEVYKKALASAFVNIRREFFEINKLEDDDVLAIKKDAIFTLRSVDTTEFENVVFKNKHRYTSYIRINTMEVYYSDRTGVDVKGINDTTVELHRDYMVKFISDICDKVEAIGISTALRYAVSFHSSYKWKELDIGYYREFNARSAYRINPAMLLDYEVAAGIEYYEKDDSLEVERLDISYNLRIIEAIVKLLIKLL